MHRRLPSWPFAVLYALTPLVFNPLGRWAFELPKSRAVYIALLLLALAALWRARRVTATWVTAVVLAYLAGMLLVGVLHAEYPLRAFFGSYERQLGFLGLLHLLLLPLFVPADAKEARGAILRGVTYGALGVGLLTLLHYAPRTPFAPVFSYGDRLYGPFGEPNLLGMYLALTLFPAWAHARQGGRARWAGAAAIVLALAVIVLSGSRGALLAAGLFIVALALSSAGTLWRTHRAALVAGAAAVMLGGAVLLAVQLAEPRSYVRLRLLNNETVRIRTLIWAQTWRSAQEAPWLGHGLEALLPAFQARPEELSRLLFDPEEPIDRAHNDFLDHVHAGGLAGMLLYLLLLGGAVAGGVRRWRMGRDPVPLGLTAQYLAVSSVGPVHASHILLFATALLLLHLGAKARAWRMPVWGLVFAGVVGAAGILWHLSIIFRDVR